jgi:hypothetical protein
MRCAIVAATLLVLLVAPLPRPEHAHAACHIAVFTQGAYSVREDAGPARVVVFLQGRQPSCSGAVRYETASGTATAPSDYTAVQGEICFRANDDREETITIPIVNDSSVEGDERFTVRLSDAERNDCQPDGISSTATATVTIVNDDRPPQATAPAATAAPTTATATARPTGSPTPEPSPTPTPTRTPSPTPTQTAFSPAPLAAPEEGDDNRTAILVLAVVAAVAALGAAGGLWYFRRRGA